jgi:hypothetical protein
MDEVTLHVKHVDEYKLIMSVYVDDLLITRDKKKLVEKFKTNIKDKFKMNELSLLSYFLGMEVTQFEQGYFLYQKSFSLKILNNFAMVNCKPVSTPMILGQKLMKEDEAPKTDGKSYRSLVGSLLYLTATRPDILFVVNYLSRYMQDPSQIHFMAVKRVLRYLKGTVSFGMHFMKSSFVNLVGFSNNNWGESDKGMMSISGYSFAMGDRIFCWNSKKQSVVAHSMAEAEYIVIYVAAKQLIWLRNMLNDLDFNQ